MGRDFSFQWQSPSQWGEMVTLGMGHPFKLITCSSVTKNNQNILNIKKDLWISEQSVGGRTCLFIVGQSYVVLHFFWTMGVD